MIEITTPVGRLVTGHPMVSHPVMDEKVKPPVPKMQSDGVAPMIQFYFGIAIPKGTEQHWNQTEWGSQIWRDATTSWPNGEYNAPTFAWKIDDGDSQVPNKRGIKPCDREGWAGHWIIHCSNGFPVKCYHRGMYEPHQVMQRKEEIKTGDYVRAVIVVKSNEARHPNTPGMYVNPSLFELYQAGVEIISANTPSASETFGAVQGALPANAQVDPNVGIQTPSSAPTPAPTPGNGPAAPAPTPAPTPGNGPAAPAPDYVTPPTMYVGPDGNRYTKDQLLAGGWNEQQIATLQTV